MAAGADSAASSAAWNPPMSPPAEKARSPRPVRTTTRTASSSPALARASTSDPMTSAESAFRRSSRSIVIHAAGPRRS
jgi:hypothetical protein